ncbi:MAG: hypothetical protein SGJ09_00050 [Phycisphaerae bacterium]|nr:hypothetical protein [Phycisphaerae bacterium]
MRIGGVQWNTASAASTAQGAARAWWRARFGGGRVRAVFWSIVIVLLAIPIVALFILVIAILVAVAIAASIVGGIRNALGGQRSLRRAEPRDGRENVRVIGRTGSE